MTENRLQKRAIRILTTPQEICYAFTHHWPLIAICISLSILAVWYRLSSDPFVFEGQAQLLINPRDTLVVTSAPEQALRRGDEIGRFLFSQAGILSSDAVIAKLLDQVPPVVDPHQEERKGALLQAIGDFKDRIWDLLSLNSPPTTDDPALRASPRAVEAFRLRSKIVPDPAASTIDLKVYGTSPEQTRKELEAWIIAYNSRIGEMARESWEKFLSDRIQYYQNLEDASRKLLDAFKGANPDVTELNQDFLAQQIALLQVRRDDLQRHLDSGEVRAAAATAPAPLSTDDPVLLKNKYDQELIEARARGYTEKSDQVQRILKKIELVESKIQSRGPEEPSTEEQKEDKARAELDSMTKQLETLYARKASLREKLSQLEELRREYTGNREKREKYVSMNQESLDMIESRKNVQVQVSDRPKVGSDPFNYHPLRSLLKALATGLCAGCFSALLLEIGSRRVRFLSDVECDVGLPVVSVIPKR